MALQISTTWASVKAVAIAKTITPKWIEIDGCYYASVTYDVFEIVCKIVKSISGEEKSSEQLDFEGFTL